jgi:hypothetical protein
MMRSPMSCAAKLLTERIAMVLDCNRTARLLLQAATKRRHPEWTDAQVLAEVARRMLRCTRANCL